MDSSFYIGKASSRDARHIAQVWVDVWRSTYQGLLNPTFLNELSYEKSEAGWKKIFLEGRPQWHTFLTKDELANGIGFSTGGPNRRLPSREEGELYAIYVRKEFQKRGIGKKLLFSSFEQLLREGFSRAIVWVLAENPARTFYAAMGGSPAGERNEEIGGQRVQEVSFVWPDLRATVRKYRPGFQNECIEHFTNIQEADNAHYPKSSEKLSIGSPFGRHFGFKRLGIHHEILLAGRRTSWPHAESTEEEFVFVIEGHPQVWIDGHLHDLKPGDGIGFVPGTGTAHTFINNSGAEVRLLVVGDTNREDNRCVYPLHPERNKEMGDFLWKEFPIRPLGPHDGLPEELRNQMQ